MKTIVDDARGVVIHRDGMGTYVEGLTYSTNKDHQAPSANVGVLLFDLHFNKNKPGSTVLNGTV